MQIDGISSPAVSAPTNARIGQTNFNTIEKAEVKIPNNTRSGEERKAYEEKRFSEEDVIGIIEKANKDFIAYDRKFEFSIHEATKQIMVKVIDANTDEVIRELPPEKVLDMVAAIWEVAGIIVDRKI